MVLTGYNGEYAIGRLTKQEIELIFSLLISTNLSLVENGPGFSLDLFVRSLSTESKEILKKMSGEAELLQK